MEGWSCPTGPATSQMPASPASPPESPKHSHTVREREKPPKAAARGASPLTRISKPLSVRDMNTKSTATATSARSAPRCTRPAPRVGRVCQAWNSIDSGKL